MLQYFGFLKLKVMSKQSSPNEKSQLKIQLTFKKGLIFLSENSIRRNSLTVGSVSNRP